MAFIFSARKKEKKNLGLYSICQRDFKTQPERFFSSAYFRLESIKKQTAIRIDYHSLDFSAWTLIDVISRPDLEMSKVRWNEEMRRIWLFMMCLRSPKYITHITFLIFFTVVKLKLTRLNLLEISTKTTICLQLKI